MLGFIADKMFFSKHIDLKAHAFKILVDLILNPLFEM